jgi:hypothetical protein
MCTKFWSENLKERDYSKDMGRDGWIALKWNLKVEGCGF